MFLCQKSSCGHPFLNAQGIFQKSTCSHELRIYNVFDRYFKGIELIHNSGFSLPFDEWPFLYYKRTIAATHSFKFTVFLRNKSCRKEISQLLIMEPPWFQECIHWIMLPDDMYCTHSFFLWWCHYFKGIIEAIYMSKTLCLFYNTCCSHRLQPAVCEWFEKTWTVCSFQESHCSPALLKMPTYSTELVAVIFVWKVVC